MHGRVGDFVVFLFWSFLDAGASRFNSYTKQTKKSNLNSNSNTNPESKLYSL